jgi:hypothetical protein
MYNAACGMRHTMGWRQVVRLPTRFVSHSTSCIIQFKAPDDGQNYCPKHVELM